MLVRVRRVYMGLDFEGVGLRLGWNIKEDKEVFFYEEGFNILVRIIGDGVNIL